MDIEKVEIPMFELAGPPCKDKSCKGVLVTSMVIKTRVWKHVCSICKSEVAWGDDYRGML